VGWVIKKELGKIAGAEAKPVNFDVLAIWLYIFAALTFVWFFTFVDLAPTLANKAQIGVLIGAIGLLLSVILSKAPTTALKMTVSVHPPAPLEFAKKISTLMLMTLMSVGLQVILIIGAQGYKKMAAIAPAIPAIYLVAFFLGMAVWENGFFQVMLYRFLKFAFSWFNMPRLPMGKIFALTLCGLVFGFYHYNVYNKDPVFMAAAFIGSIFFNLSLDGTNWVSGGAIPHLIQNAPFAVISLALISLGGP